MNIQEQEKVFDEFVANMRQIMFKKGNDYSLESDRLSNFKLAGSICGLKPEQNCLSLIATKVARLGSLLSSPRPPANESVDDTLIDLANYTLLLKMLMIDGYSLYSVVPGPGTLGVIPNQGMLGTVPGQGLDPERKLGRPVI